MIKYAVNSATSPLFRQYVRISPLCQILIGGIKVYQSLKEEIKEIIEIVDQCPEELQQKCFELLLNNYLVSIGKSTSGADSKTAPIKIDDASINMTKTENIPPNGEIVPVEEITIKDFHVKMQRFLQTNNISTKEINNLYYKENSQLMPLYESLNSTNMSECQIRLALLSAFENAFGDGNGDMSFNCEEIRSRCQTMKCYNSANFSTYFKANINLWENWPEKYDKNAEIFLSVEGKKELAKVIIELSGKIS
jgi:hypothetical protein